MKQQSTPSNGFLVSDYGNEITEIGTINGGQYFDVLAVAFGPNERRIRVRFEQTGHWMHIAVRDHESLEDAVKNVAEVLWKSFAGARRDPPRFYRGHHAQQWMARLIGNAEKVAKRENRVGTIARPLNVEV